MFSWASVKNHLVECILLVALGLQPARAQLPSRVQQQIKTEAASLAKEPTRISLAVASQGVRVGGMSQLKVTLLSAENEPVPAKEDSQFDVTIQLPSGSTSTQKVLIKKGETSEQFQFSADAAGLASITARPTTGNIRPARTDVLIVPAPSTRRPTRPARPGAYVAPLDGVQTAEEQEFDGSFAPQTQIKLISAPLGSFYDRQDRVPALVGSPRLHISINNVGSNYIANGKDTAEITAYFESPNHTPASEPINLWFKWTNGALDPQPLQIEKGSYSGKTHLTSNWPGNVHVTFVNSNPPLEADGDTEFDVQFVPLGVTLVGPDKLSVVDNEPAWVVFFDERGPIAPGKDWQVTVHSTGSKLRLTPQNLVVQKNSPTGATLLFPISVGTDRIEAFVAGYQPQPLKIIITGWFVLILCLLGGAVGGAAGHNAFGGSWFWRVFLGVVGGALLCWLYVYLALTSLAAGDLFGNIAHNPFSVFFVALIGGFLGIKVLDVAAKKLGVV